MLEVNRNDYFFSDVNRSCFVSCQNLTAVYPIATESYVTAYVKAIDNEGFTVIFTSPIVITVANSSPTSIPSAFPSATPNPSPSPTVPPTPSPTPTFSPTPAATAAENDTFSIAWLSDNRY